MDAIIVVAAAFLSAVALLGLAVMAAAAVVRGLRYREPDPSEDWSDYP